MLVLLAVMMIQQSMTVAVYEGLHVFSCHKSKGTPHAGYDSAQHPCIHFSSLWKYTCSLVNPDMRYDSYVDDMMRRLTTLHLPLQPVDTLTRMYI